MSASPFRSVAGFRALFEDGLHRLLDDDALGAFILVLANAGFDPAVMEALGERLGQRFEQHKQRCRHRLLQGQALPDADDDVQVFLKLALLSLEQLGQSQTRQIGPWEAQFNLLRAFRPKRMSGVAAPGIQAPFDAGGFHFNRPFLRKESIWTGKLDGRPVDLLYNKFPFAELHGLLAPQREQQLPQFLSRDMHDYIWRLCQALSEGLPGLGFAYNSYGAFASVNHLHFQMFVRPRALPLQAPMWRHNGGQSDYPARCAVFDAQDEAWPYLHHLHREQTPYNLIYTPQALYCLPRARQGSYPPAAWSGGYAWYEMAGGVLAFNKNDFDALDADAISGELARVSGGDASPG
jgi:hypothetical protein